MKNEQQKIVLASLPMEIIGIMALAHLVSGLRRLGKDTEKEQRQRVQRGNQAETPITTP